MTACAGDWVEIQSKEEILAALDKNGRLEGLPFMPQMFEYCGQRFRVQSRAYKTCDTVSGHYAGRRLSDAVHLDIRCNGQAYGGCQAGCLISWKSAWLRPVDGPVQAPHTVDGGRSPFDDSRWQDQCTEQDVWRATTYKDAVGEGRYSCQATELLNYTAPLTHRSES
jgi:hypothetical protein